jgi:hypothetical protein
MAIILHGIAIRITHLGRLLDGISIDDIQDVITDEASDLGWPQAGRTNQVYVPRLGSILVLYSDSTAKSFEKGGIRTFIQTGDIRAEFVFGSDFLTALNSNVVKGNVVFENNIDTMAVVFITPYADDEYYLSFGTLEATVGVANVNVYYSDKNRFGFTVHISAAPGIGNSVAVDWTCFHA